MEDKELKKKFVGEFFDSLYEAIEDAGGNPNLWQPTATLHKAA